MKLTDAKLKAMEEHAHRCLADLPVTCGRLANNVLLLAAALRVERNNLRLEDL